MALNCPFALLPGQQPTVIDGREIPPKSERSCNFTALTVPGGLPFAKMPRYIREWPGVRKDILIDAFDDQIITFQTAETGVGAWWYWLTQRAVNGPNLNRRGFTHRQADAERSREGDRGRRAQRRLRPQDLSEPYLRFASDFFGRTIAETEST